MRHLGDKVRETRLRWFECIKNRESEYITKTMLEMEKKEKKNQEDFGERD